MADTLTGVTETSAVGYDAVSQVIQRYLIQESVLLPTVTDYSFMAQKGAKSIDLGRSDDFSVSSKSENTSADATAITYSSDTITLDQHRYVQFLLEDRANLQAYPEIVQDKIMKAVKPLALDMDEKVIAELDNASASAPDHQIVFADTSGDVLARADILEARRLLRLQNINPRECYLLIGPEKEAEMLAITDFIDASKYGSNEAVMNGEIGQVFGLKVIVHTSVTDKMYTYHPSAVGFAIQQGIRYQSDYDLKELGWRHSLDYLAGFEVLDSGKRVVVTDSTN